MKKHYNRRTRTISVRWEVSSKQHRRALEAANTFGLSGIEEYIKLIMRAKGLIPKGWK